MEADEGETVTVVTTAGGGGGGGRLVTVTTAVPLLPELVAVIVAEPAEIPATTPSELTEASARLLVDHDTVCPLMTIP
jgi:predicted glycosyltransferase